MTDPSDHKCPKNGCEAMLPFETFACRRHWFSLPPSLRWSLGVLWRRGEIDAYLAQRDKAVAVLNAEPEYRGVPR